MFFSAYAVLPEKLKRSLESLLATPLTLRQIWLGKALAVFLPSALLGISLMVLAIVLSNTLFIMSAAGHFVGLPPASLVVCLVTMPATIFLLVCITTLLQLVLANPRMVNILFFFFIFGTASCLMYVPIEITTWSFTLLSISLVAVLVLLTLSLTRLLTTERVVLTSKG